MSWCRIRCLVGFLFLLVAAAAGASGSSAQPVSPGGIGHALEVPGPCPSFSWSAQRGATAYELAVLDVTDAESPRLVYSHRIVGSAFAWTPARDGCLAFGRDYAWVVRAAVEGSGFGDWSAPRLFRIPGAPSAEEVAAALEVLERWRATRTETDGEASGADVASSGKEGTSRARGPAPASSESPLATGVAAIRGEIPDASGAAFGVLGISHSPQGAGVVARNESAGADLILDGEAQGQADTLLTQSGLDRPSAAAQTFNIGNSGAGAMTLEVDGVAVDTALTAIAWARLVSVPADLADGDQDTTYSAGNQLQLTGTTFDVLEGSGSGLDADTLDGLHAAAMQQRVSGICLPGSALVAIHADGSVVCIDFPFAPVITVVSDDPAPNNADGLYSSIAIGADGLPVISFTNAQAGTLKVAKCNDAACAGWNETITVLEGGPGNSLGSYTSIALGGDGFPVISYRQDEPTPALKVVKCNDAACSGFDETITTIDSSGDVGQFTSIAIGGDGFPVVSYYDATAGALKVAKCNDAACTGDDETITTLDSSGDVGQFTSIAIGGDGYPIVSYYDASAQALKVVKCDDAACAGGGETITPVEDTASDVGQYSSIAIGGDGLPVISYYDASAGALKVAKCNDTACTGDDETITTVDDDANDVGRYASLAVAGDGLPVISYYDASAGALKVAKCHDVACAGGDATITTVDDPPNDVGRYTSLANGGDGLPVISYYDASAGALKVAKCKNSSCWN